MHCRSRGYRRSSRPRRAVPAGSEPAPTFPEAANSRTQEQITGLPPAQGPEPLLQAFFFLNSLQV